MLDLKYIRQNFDEVQATLGRRGEYDLQQLRDLDQQQRAIEGERSQLQARSNEIGKAVGQKIREGADPKGEEVAALREDGNQVKAQLGELEPKERELKATIETLLLALPNFPSKTTPDGKDESENMEVRRWGDEYLPADSASLKPHWEVGEALGIFNFERSTKIAKVALSPSWDWGLHWNGPVYLYAGSSHSAWLHRSYAAVFDQYNVVDGVRPAAQIRRGKVSGVPRMICGFLPRLKFP